MSVTLTIVYDPAPDLDLSIFICGDLVRGVPLLRLKIPMPGSCGRGTIEKGRNSVKAIKASAIGNLSLSDIL